MLSPEFKKKNKLRLYSSDSKHESQIEVQESFETEDAPGEQMHRQACMVEPVSYYGSKDNSVARPRTEAGKINFEQMIDDYEKMTDSMLD